MSLRLALEKNLYRLVWMLALPLLPLRLFLRGLKEQGYRHHWAERFGRSDLVRGEPIWIHAVSVGEMQAAAPLVRALQSGYPEIPLLLTCMTATGRAAAQRLFGTNVAVRYLPYDFPWAARRFLRLQRPRLGVLMETEIWPELVSACQMLSVPVYLVNARMSARSAKGYARLRDLAGDTLKKFSGIAAQYEEDAERLRALGAANVRVSGNLKFDFEPDTAQVADGRAWHAAWGADRPVLLAASTREGEEVLILDAVARYANASWLLVLVPRHPQRFDEVAALIVKHGLKFQRKSASNEVPSEVRVLLGDSMGEMTRYYACCDAAFIGGSLLPFGGQNLIEAAACGVPVLVGNHTFNFERIADMALACGAARRVGDAHALVLAAKELMDDKATRESMSRNALEFARRNRGAVKKVLALLADSPALDQRLR